MLCLIFRDERNLGRGGGWLDALPSDFREGTENDVNGTWQYFNDVVVLK
jgi:hypothetical protein